MELRQTKMDCPFCGNAKTKLLEGGVDIGVGVQWAIIDASCGNCGIIAPCYKCGAWSAEQAPPKPWVGNPALFKHKKDCGGHDFFC